MNERNTDEIGILAADKDDRENTMNSRGKAIRNFPLLFNGVQGLV